LVARRLYDQVPVWRSNPLLLIRQVPEASFENIDNSLGSWPNRPGTHHVFHRGCPDRSNAAP
jgi:hypothetical protein